MTTPRKLRTLHLEVEDAKPWEEIDFTGKGDPVKHFHREMFWVFERNRKTIDRIVAPCPIKQNLFEGERPHDIVLKQAASGSRVNVRCREHHDPRTVVEEIIRQLTESS